MYSMPMKDRQLDVDGSISQTSFGSWPLEDVYASHYLMSHHNASAHMPQPHPKSTAYDMTALHDLEGLRIWNTRSSTSAISQQDLLESASYAGSIDEPFPVDAIFSPAVEFESYVNTPDSSVDALNCWSDLNSVYSETASDMIDEPLPSWMNGFAWPTSAPHPNIPAPTSAPKSPLTSEVTSPMCHQTPVRVPSVSEAPPATEVDILMQKLSTPEPAQKPVERRPHACPQAGCDKTFTQPTHLRIHLRSHTGEKPYTCLYPSCGSSFSQLGNLRTHERRHKGLKPNRRRTVSDPATSQTYVCKLDDCHTHDLAGGRIFTQLGNLKAHMNKFHKQTLETLTEKLASTDDSDLSLDEIELRDYFRRLFRHCNRGIKGRGKGRKVEVVA